MSTTPKKWTAENLPNLSGRTVVITGASSGLGAITARELARSGARVVMAVRDMTKGQSVAGTIPGKTEVRQLDLTSLASIRQFATSWTGDIDVLINNAGVMYAPEGRTSDGFELHIGINHLGHFALTSLLLPHISDRVVTLTSNLASGGKIDLGDLNWERRSYKASQAYSDSKQANILFTDEFSAPTDKYRQLRPGRLGPPRSGEKSTLMRSACPRYCTCQVRPPSTVARIRLLPTTHPWSEDTNCTSLSSGRNCASFVAGLLGRHSGLARSATKGIVA